MTDTERREILSLLPWEIGWLVVELGLVWVGLFLLLSRGHARLGSMWLLGVVLLSFAVRMWRYTHRSPGGAKKTKPADDWGHELLR